MTVDLTRLAAVDAMSTADALDVALAAAPTAEAAARTLCVRLRDELVTPEGERACVLVRCYVTHAYGGLPPDLQRFAKRAFGAVAITPPEPDMRCLVLLATAGDEAAWNDRRRSVGHQAIPLPSPHIVARAPMIAQLVRELGLDLSHVVRPHPGLVRERAVTGQGVFHVPTAAGSPYIPAQDFVTRHGVQSVVGFGGLLPTGELCATILFARVSISLDVADRFGPLAVAMTQAIGADGRPMFDEPPATPAERPG